MERPRLSKIKSSEIAKKEPKYLERISISETPPKAPKCYTAVSSCSSVISSSSARHVPLLTHSFVHTLQVVTLAVYSYFVASLFSHQFLAEDSEFKYYHVDLFIPFTCVLELVFYIGWLKVTITTL